ncbi:MAG TPA: response regulator [Blastocatellia bacterium]|nr:response regulator [Blastocatellia bacterium]
MKADLNSPQPNYARLLVIDDDESVAITVSEVLRREGYIVDTAMSGPEALSHLRKAHYDLVLTDLHMEGMDGISVLAEIRHLVPFAIAIVLTGFASLESAIAAMRQGAYDYLIKPCNIDDMKHTIRRGLDHRRLLLAEQQARANLEQLNRELEQRVEDRTAQLRRLNEELANANREKDVFLATLSHELRTPLTPILGWARLLRSGKADQSLMSQGLDAIERNAKLQTRLIDDLLDVSRIVMGKLSFDKEPTDLRSVVEAAVETVRDKAKARDIELKVAVPGEPVIVQGAPVRLQQIVWNFLSNAIKFTPKGGAVSIEVIRSREEARVAVSDTGAGIAPDFLPHVFEAFRQADESLTRRHGGLGLGLAIVKRLAELHGGRVCAESEGLGKGTRFTCILPCVAGANVGYEKEAGLTVYSMLQRVLIVEDSVDTLEMMRALFEAMGCSVMTADSVEAALALAAAQPPSVIISDIGMPNADGYELLARLRLLPGLQKVPAIAVSGYAAEEDTARAIAAGFSAHLAKPVDIDKLLTLIQSLAS